MSDLLYPVETINLPSGGKYYPKGHPLRESGGQLELKYMTAKEEDILTSTNLIQNGTVLDRLLDSIVVHDGVTPTDLTTGDVNAVLIAARVLAYGKDYEVQIPCDSCGTPIDHVVDLTQLESPDELTEVDEDGCHQFTTDTGLDIVIRSLTRGDEISLLKNNKILDTKYNKRVSSAITSRLKVIVVSINGESDKNALMSIIDNLVVKDSKRIREELVKINPSVDMLLEVTCQACDEITRGGMPIGLNFFWPDTGV